MTRRILIALLLFATRPVLAQDVEGAKQRAGELVTQGNQLFEAKKFDEALASFESAYQTFPSPKIHYNLARTLAACERPLEAIEHYEEFLADVELSPSDARFQRAKEEMARLEVTIGNLVFVTPIAGSKLTLDDGRPQPVPEETIRVMPGPHEVVIETPDGRRFEETVSVGPGETTRVHVLFPSLAPPPPPASELVATTKPDSPPITSTWWFWTAIGAAVLAVGAGVGVGLATRPGEFVREGELDVTSTEEWDRR